MYSDKLVQELACIIGHTKAGEGYNNWHKRPEIQEAYRILARNVISSADLHLEPGYGRGIVMAGGGLKYFPSVWVNVRRIRELGCKLPIELWYLGDAEMDPWMIELLKPYDVLAIDALKLRKLYPARILNGWELKPYAIIHSSFNEVLFLDADSVPVRNPEYLFDVSGYKAMGAIMWPDFPHWLLKPEVYPVFGCKPPLNTSPPGLDHEQFGKAIDTEAGWDVAVESGQLVINRQRCALPLQLTMHFCEHSDYYFTHVHGDKEAFHLAWRCLDYPYAMPQYWPGWDKHTALQHDFTGSLLFVHRNQDKWNLAGTNVKGNNPYEEDGFRLIAELKKTWSGKLWHNPAPTKIEQELMKAAPGMWLYHRKGHDARLLELVENGRIGKGAAPNELRWAIIELASGQRVLMLGGANTVTCIYKHNGECWEGNWLINEKMPTTLTKLDE